MLPLGKSAALAVLLAVLPITSVMSLHELDHRYDVMGYILGTDEQAIPGVAVVAYLGDKRMGSGRSDSDGYYRFRLHLHDSDVGRELRLKASQSQGSVRISLTPGDTSTERLHHVNFVGGKLLEGELSGRAGVSTTMVAAGVAGVVLVAGTVAAMGLRRRRQQRAQRKATKAQNRRSSKRRKRKHGGR